MVRAEGAILRVERKHRAAVGRGGDAASDAAREGSGAASGRAALGVRIRGSPGQAENGCHDRVITRNNGAAAGFAP